jgi:hypothetical protein
LTGLGMKLNTEKTKYSDNVISSSIKPDKLSDTVNQTSSKDITKELFIISSISENFPNS